MLELYRASAGSGKTYTLAKKYIWYFLTISPEGGKPRLRTDAELADSARHILAVTFTNKATNEMQQRIVGSLFSLANQPLEWKTDNGRRVIRKPEYMQDFLDELGESATRIAAAAGKALGLLLENYSDFNVSTIDSFFQQVLRTFAYESEINDTYQVELDNDYVSQVSVDATLEEADSNDTDADTPFWLQVIMNRVDKGKWNIFSRTVRDKNSKDRSENPYMDFVRSVGRMENEQYKLIRDEVEEYFAGRPDLRKLYEDLCVRYESPVKGAFGQMRQAFSKLDDMLPDELRNASTRSDLGKFALHVRRASAMSLKWNSDPGSSSAPSLSEALLDKKNVKAWLKSNPEVASDLSCAVVNAVAAQEKWKASSCSEEYRHWCLYAVNLPFYALFDIVNRKRREYLDETNAVELGETSMILRGVIGDSDTPFIYERLGTYLNHFLIDEFQDTSRLQWENLSPLLHESMSRDNGNLIIGDAKQSIYRFRNAEPSLITSVVPAEFGSRVKARGMVPAENTNYRSDLRVVEFNNSFFEYFVGRLDELIGDFEAPRMKFSPLYANVVQRPNKTKPAGYVEIRMSGDAKGTWAEKVLQKLPLLVDDIVSRGYSFKDIAVLVQTNGEGNSVIDAFTKYNSLLPEGGREIRFVSEQSLTVASSRAVKIIVNVLDNIARGSKPEIRSGEEWKKFGAGNWAELAANFKYFAAGRPDEPIAERLDAYLESGNSFDALSSLLRSMQSLALPTLVEAITSQFVDDALKEKDALYIAAFQDLVLEYCDGHSTDIGSFLKWWERKSRSAAVSSPENTDAVQVVTVHKSKGLQYKCVIVPFADWDFADTIPQNKKEWRWVRPEVISHPDIELPPYIPVETSKEMASTSHAGLLMDFFDKRRMDALNSAYVAFTRAEKELYIFCVTSSLPRSEGARSGAPSSTLGNYLYDFIAQSAEREAVAIADGEVDPRIPASEVSGVDSEGVARIGIRPDSYSQESCKEKKSAEKGQEAYGNKDACKEKKRQETVLLDRYDAVAAPKFLKYHGAGLPGQPEKEEERESMEIDPRAEGTLKHAVLELVKVREDLPAAVRHLRLTGVIPSALAPDIEASLSEKLAGSNVRAWFDGSARVFTERPVLEGGHVTRRPDRLLVCPDGSAVVVDYKFGKVDTTGKYRRQIGEYVRRLRRTGRYTSVRGYLWYVNADKIELV